MSAGSANLQVLRNAGEKPGKMDLFPQLESSEVVVGFCSCPLRVLQLSPEGTSVRVGQVHRLEWQNRSEGHLKNEGSAALFFPRETR